jgi:glycosyltransferase involved in cell wall biosynthesis
MRPPFDLPARGGQANGPHLVVVPASGPRPTLSVVVPVFNEAEVLPELNRRLFAMLASLEEYGAEVIYIDDGSTDASASVLDALRHAHPAVGVMRLSRNFGKELALSAGLRASSGDCVIVIDADLQDPPELIPAMVTAWEAGHDLVNMRRRSRAGETWLKKLTARLFYRMLNRLSDIPIPADVGDFRLLSRRVVEALNSLPERNRYMKGLFAWVGYSQVTLDYDRAARVAGQPQQTYGRLCTLAIEAITSFSVAPLRLALVTGLAAAAAAFGLTVFYLAKTLLFGDAVTGFPTLIVTILTLGGLNLLGLGVLGEYLGRLFMETKQRPLYLVDRFAPPQSRGLPSRRPRRAKRPDAVFAETVQ